MSVKPIHHYSMENPASVYDEEALTALELAARTAGKVNECVKAFNNHEDYTHKVIEEFKQDTNEDVGQFKEDTNADIAQFKEDTNDDIDRFKQNVNQSIEDQDQDIEDAVSYMKASIRSTTADELAGMKESGELDHIIEGSVFTDFSHRTENMVTPEMFGAKGDGVTDDSSAFQQAVNTGKTVYLGNKVYVLNETINLPVGAEITGSKNSIVWAYAPTVFHITEKNTISGFTIRVKSTNVLSVFEADDNSGGWNMAGDGALLFTTISNMTVYRDVQEDTPMYTVCHFHVTDNAFYDIKVTGCTFVNNGTCGYGARVYSNGEGWLSTCSFIDNNTSSFKWHYFFAEDESKVSVKSTGGHFITNCTGQCTPATNGFVFMYNCEVVKITRCMPWDWGSSESGSTNCPGNPYIIHPDAMSSNIADVDCYRNDISIESIMCFDGTNFTSTNHDATLSMYAGAQYSRHLIPKFVGIPMVPAVKLITCRTVNDYTRVRFYLCDGRGITYVSIYPGMKKVVLSRPIDNIDFGLGADGKTIYMTKRGGGNLEANTAIMTLPISNLVIKFGEGNIHNQEFTPDVWKEPKNRWLDAIPTDIEMMPKRVDATPYVTDDAGNFYKISVVTNEDGTQGLGVTRVYESPSERTS